MKIELRENWWMTMAGCQAAVAQLKQLRTKSNNAVLNSRTATARERAKEFDRRVITAIAEVKDRIRALSDYEGKSFAKVLTFALQKRVSPEVFEECLAETHREIEARKAMVEARGVGSAIAMLGTTGGMKQREVA